MYRVAKKHKPHDEEHIDETWLIPYADLLTLLLALFIVLFASSQVDQQKLEKMSDALSGAFNGGFSFFQNSDVVPMDEESMNRDENTERETETEKDPLNIEKSESFLSNEELERFRQETANLEELKKQLDQYINENGLDTQLETKLNQHQLMITISDNALFTSGSAEIKLESQNLARAVGEMLKDYPQYEIEIAGHTDNRSINTPEFPSNWDLSAKRALNFMKILLEEEGTSPERFSTIGYGEYRPIATNETVEGRSKNRRVEVSVLRNFQDDLNN
jgi:chemotaxis protein MotB